MELSHKIPFQGVSGVSFECSWCRESDLRRLICYTTRQKKKLKISEHYISQSLANCWSKITNQSVKSSFPFITLRCGPDDMHLRPLEKMVVLCIL